MGGARNGRRPEEIMMFGKRYNFFSPQGHHLMPNVQLNPELVP
jgi:hypothetical protein